MTVTKVTANNEIEHLTTAECWRLLECSALGRLAVGGSSGTPDLFPVNFTAHSGALYVRSAPGSKLMDIADHPGVAFEIDGEDPHSHWSVVIKGEARRLDADDEIHESGVEDLVSASPTSKQNFIRITPRTVTGRRFRKDAAVHAVEPATATTGAHEPTRPPEEDAAFPGAGAAAATGPIPIPHFPPLSGR